MKNTLTLIITILLLTCMSCQNESSPTVEQWTTHEINLTAEQSFQNPYTDVEVWAEFKSNKGLIITRPAFWNGGSSWVVRFAPPDSDSEWKWRSFSSPEDKGLAGIEGSLKSVAYTGNNKLLRHGLLRMSAGKRNVVHADGKPFLVVGDTPWSIPFRAQPDEVKVYAEDRQRKGFNTALLMSLQPDRYAEGPEQRGVAAGYARAFTDLPDGHLNQLKTEYFQYLDSLIAILIDHEIVPVYQPVFHGFGWKGKTVLGTTA